MILRPRTPIVVVTGLPCSGKSKLAEQLTSRLGWPLLSKDVYKELLFDTLGHSDREWSRRVSLAAYALMFAQAKQLAAARTPCIIEGNFRPAQHIAQFAELQAFGIAWLQVHCRAAADVLAERFVVRAATGQRHPGHVDAASRDEIVAELRSTVQQPLALRDAMLIDCDTTEDWQGAIAAAAQLVVDAVAGRGVS